MKIGIDARAADWYRGTGIGTYTYQLINSLIDVDSENQYTLFLSSREAASKNVNTNVHCKIIPNNQNTNFWDQVKLPVVLEKENIQLYHIPQNGVGMPKHKTCPYVITLHDIIPLKMPETVSDRYLKIFHEELPESLQFCDGIITVSNYSKKDISEAFNFPLEKIYVTYLASEDIYSPINRSESKKYIQDKYGISTDIILYVGGFSPRKNILSLIDAFSLLPSRHIKKNTLVIAGNKGQSYELYRARVEKLHLEDHVFFTGFVSMEDMPQLYRAAELLVYPSFYEGFGLPPLEAMASGTPVVAATSTSIPEICGDACLLVNPYEITEIKDAMLSILEDTTLKNALVEKGIKKAESFCWSDTALETIKVYESIIR